MFGEWFEFFSTILGASIPVSLVGVFFIILLIYKIFRLELEKIFSFLLKFLTLIFKGCKLFQTWYIKFDFQARVNLFTNKFLSKKIQDFQAKKIQINWINPEQKAEDFIEGGKIIVKMHKSDNQNKNFDGCYCSINST